MLEALPLDTLQFFNIHLEISPPRTKSSLQIMVLLKTSSVVPLGHHSDIPANRSKFCLSGKYPCLEKNLDCYSLPAMFQGWHVTQFWPMKCKGSLLAWKDRGARRKLLFSPFASCFEWWHVTMWWLGQKQPSCEPEAEESKIEEWKGPESLMDYWVTEPDLKPSVKQKN